VSRSPADEYRARLEARGATLAALNASELRFSQARLGTFGLLVLVAVFAWLEALSAFWLILPVVGLAVLIQRHDRVIRARDATARAIAFYERGLARIEDRWVGGGSSATASPTTGTSTRTTSTSSAAARCSSCSRSRGQGLAKTSSRRG
jgi:hypothetical protein